MSTTPNDPAAMFRMILGQWEAMSNASGDAAKDGVPGGSGVGAGAAAAQMMGKQMLDRAMAAANIPSRTELEELTARLGRVEAALFRIEARLSEGTPDTATKPSP